MNQAMRSRATMSDETTDAGAGPGAFGVWVRQLRAHLDWNQERLAKEVWVDPSTVFYWETRERRPNLATHKRLEALATLHNFPPPPPRPSGRVRRPPDASAEG